MWMAYDTRERRYVALKILTSAKRRHTYRESDAINERLQGRRKSNLVTYYKMFELPTGKRSYIHRVLVLPLMGSNLDQTCLEMPTSTYTHYRMSTAWQLLLSLKDLHKAKIVHRGKPKPFSHLPQKIGANAFERSKPKSRNVGNKEP